MSNMLRLPDLSRLSLGAPTGPHVDLDDDVHGNLMFTVVEELLNEGHLIWHAEVCDAVLGYADVGNLFAPTIDYIAEGRAKNVTMSAAAVQAFETKMRNQFPWQVNDLITKASRVWPMDPSTNYTQPKAAPPSRLTVPIYTAFEAIASFRKTNIGYIKTLSLRNSSIDLLNFFQTGMHRNVPDATLAYEDPDICAEFAGRMYHDPALLNIKYNAISIDQSLFGLKKFYDKYFNVVAQTERLLDVHLFEKIFTSRTGPSLLYDYEIIGNGLKVICKWVSQMGTNFVIVVHRLQLDKICPYSSDQTILERSKNIVLSTINFFKEYRLGKDGERSVDQMHKNMLMFNNGTVKQKGVPQSRGYHCFGFNTLFVKNYPDIREAIVELQHTNFAVIYSHDFVAEGFLKSSYLLSGFEAALNGIQLQLTPVVTDEFKLLRFSQLRSILMVVEKVLQAIAEKEGVDQEDTKRAEVFTPAALARIETIEESMSPQGRAQIKAITKSDRTAEQWRTDRARINRSNRLGVRATTSSSEDLFGFDDLYLNGVYDDE